MKNFSQREQTRVKTTTTWTPAISMGYKSRENSLSGKPAGTKCPPGIKAILLIIILATNITTIQAQTDQLKAFYIFNILRYVGWTDNMRSGNFIISVIGNNDVATHLKGLSNGRNVGNQVVEVREFNRLGDVGNGHVLFLGAGVNPREINQTVIENLLSKGTLIISEAQGEAPYGSSINFITKQGNLYFELNSKNANRAGLRFSSRLMAMSTAINLN